MYSGFHQKSIGLLTDLYQLTMAYGYFKAAKAEEEAVFNLYFRKNPFQGGYAIACGLENIIEYINDFHYSEEDIAYLRTLTGNDGQPLFSEDFLAYLQVTYGISLFHIIERTVDGCQSLELLSKFAHWCHLFGNSNVKMQFFPFRYFHQVDMLRTFI